MVNDWSASQLFSALNTSSRVPWSRRSALSTSNEGNQGATWCGAKRPFIAISRARSWFVFARVEVEIERSFLRSEENIEKKGGD